eukprot:scaffold282382_cov36-Tisochrysis_lutea.AAC.2
MPGKPFGAAIHLTNVPGGRVRLRLRQIFLGLEQSGDSVCGRLRYGRLAVVLFLTSGITVVKSGFRSPAAMSASKVTSEQTIALSHRRASMESRPMTMTWNWRYQSGSFSWIGQWCASTVTPDTRFMMNSAATVAFGLPTSDFLKRNWRLRLETSIVSMSITSIRPNPESARSLRSSQPRPPAPTTRMRACCCMNARMSGDGSNGSGGEGARDAVVRSHRYQATVGSGVLRAESDAAASAFAAAASKQRGE